MTIRPFRPSDADACWRMLVSEGVRGEDMHFLEGITGILDEEGVRGFFTLEMVDGFPHLRHLCVARAYRRVDRARRLIQAVRTVVCRSGSTQMLVHAKQEHITRLIRYYFRTAAYQRTVEGDSLYLVEA